MSTEKNLRDAFAGESQANRKYLAFAKKADAEGKPGIARIFVNPLNANPSNVLLSPVTIKPAIIIPGFLAEITVPRNECAPPMIPASLSL